MATVEQIRRDNLLVLLEGETEKGVWAELAEKLGKSPAQVSQWANASKDSKSGKPRNISGRIAREIERKLGKPEGWMDQPHPKDAVGELLASYDAQAQPSGSVFDALTEDERRLLANFRDLVDEDDKRHVLDEVANKAAKMRALRERFLAEIGMKVDRPVRHSADERKTEVARAALRVTDNLRQQLLFSQQPTKK